MWKAKVSEDESNLIWDLIDDSRFVREIEAAFRNRAHPSAAIEAAAESIGRGVDLEQLRSNPAARLGLECRMLNRRDHLRLGDAIFGLRNVERWNESPLSKSLGGDAEKWLLRDPADGALWVVKDAKVYGAREVATEFVIGRVAACLEIPMAAVELFRRGNRLVFGSKYFLQDGETLFHGLELFTKIYDQSVARLDREDERSFYSFDHVSDALDYYFGPTGAGLKRAFSTMLFADALLGNHDRHPQNWGVIIPATGLNDSRFAPLYDTARGVLWNIDDALLISEYVVGASGTLPSLSAKLEREQRALAAASAEVEASFGPQRKLAKERRRIAKAEVTNLTDRISSIGRERAAYSCNWLEYLRNSRPLVSWKGRAVNHFELVALIAGSDALLRQDLTDMLDRLDRHDIGEIVSSVGRPWLIGARVEAIVKCLAARKKVLRRISVGQEPATATQEDFVTWQTG